MKLTISNDSGSWQLDLHQILGFTELQKTQLAVGLQNACEEVQEMIDATSAEGQLNREIARRMNNLASQAQAAGKMSDMWTNQNSRFYKERLIIQGIRH